MTPALPMLLGVSGLVPFATLAVVLLTAPPEARAEAGSALITYGAVILAFLGGISWGSTMRDHHNQATLYILSLAPFFAAWTALLIPSLYGLWLLITAFVIAFINDLVGRRLGVTPDWFFKLRKLLTGVVLANLVMATFAMKF